MEGKKSSQPGSSTPARLLQNLIPKNHIHASAIPHHFDSDILQGAHNTPEQRPLSEGSRMVINTPSPKGATDKGVQSLRMKAMNHEGPIIKM